VVEPLLSLGASAAGVCRSHVARSDAYGVLDFHPLASFFARAIWAGGISRMSKSRRVVAYSPTARPVCCHTVPRG
jgi:hypothetical protein